ncbi:MAG: CidA/LrgA family protein [Candidatus Azobacteroides sp.]|nr:CidA/LrgA family protein [Candidatus Azobacteroides sp.]
MKQNLILQLAIILFVTYAGNFLSSLLPFPFPGVIIGLALLFVALYSGLLKVSSVREVTNILLANMTFLFIPAGTGIINSLPVLAVYWWKLLIVILISTVVTMVVTGWVVQYSIYYLRKRNSPIK